MLDRLKSDIARQKHNDFVMEAAVKSASDHDSDIKDAFLDDPDMAVMGAENDPEIAKLVDQIPEYEGQDEVSDEEIERLEESFIPETV
jgi:uncharacterized protein (DUF1778 family)